MEKLKNLLRSKWLTILLVGIVDTLIATGTLPAETKDLLTKLITGMGALYVTVEGIADIVSRFKTLVTK